jgi:hypothetical protein
MCAFLQRVNFFALCEKEHACKPYQNSVAYTEARQMAAAVLISR